MLDPIVEEEIALLDRVVSALGRRAQSEVAPEASLIEDLEKIREQLVQGEMDFFERSALNTRWNTQSALLDQLRRSRSGPQVDPSSPYFAHLRLEENGRERDLCLGRATCLENGLRIVDWRHAPIARLYYRYQQDEEYEEELSGRNHEGRVVARRAVTIRDSQLQRIESPEGVFRSDPEKGDWVRSEHAARLSGGQGSALRVHEGGEAGERRLGTDPGGSSHRADKHLPDIAGLIDPEQFALIARPSAGFVVIRGAAGSGKTTVALHRIAWLAYEEPEFDSPKSLFLVFSPALRDYVSHVLPSLGVSNVQVRTFHDWAAEQRRRILPAVPDKHREDTPARVQRLKLHPAISLALEQRVAEEPGPATPARVLDDWASVLTQPERLEKVFAAADPGGFTREQLEDVAAWCRARNDELGAYLEGEKDADAALDPEDDAIFLRAWQLRDGQLPASPGVPLRFRHLAIDEVQDFSPLEVRVLIDCLDERRSLTLAGDTQQHVMQEAGFSSWSEFFSHLGIPGTEVETLRVSYRSSREIMDFALGLLGDLREDEEVEAPRSGPPVELFHYTDHGACIAALADALTQLASSEPLASVAILTPNREISDLYTGGLAECEVPRLHQVTAQDFRFSPGIEICELEAVKGLEFDYVILVEASREFFAGDARARRLLHVGATRAIHQLWLTSVGEPALPVLEARQALDGK
ncbi:MAG: AAA family ATPase [Myxococcota bacterium]|nr:AAA family ATPase [Myxococcota bacterium]